MTLIFKTLVRKYVLKNSFQKTVATAQHGFYVVVTEHIQDNEFVTKIFDQSDVERKWLVTID